MSLDFPQQNKMVQNPPAKKGFHFPATLERAAEYIEAETIAEAEAIYHRIREATAPDAPAPTVPPTAQQQSTAPAEEEITQ